MNHTSFRHLDFVSRTKNNRLLLSRPRGHPTIHLYDNIEYDGISSVDETIDVVSQNLNASFLSPQYKRHHLHKRNHPFAGLCVVAVMVSLYLLNQRKYIPFSCKDDFGINHFWFVDTETNVRYDLTAKQYNDTELYRMYKLGKPTIYYGWGQRPAARFLKLIDTIQPNAIRYKKKIGDLDDYLQKEVT